VSFFATEYWPEEFAPRWAAYRLSPENYGTDGCNTYTRKKANCYIKEETWVEFLSCTKASDPFHGDHMLDGEKLGPSDFANTGYDRGHIAPRQAFSWHVCGTYQTFSMAKMWTGIGVNVAVANQVEVSDLAREGRTCSGGRPWTNIRCGPRLLDIRA